MNQLTVAVCRADYCANQGLYKQLTDAIISGSLPVKLKQENCLGGCKYKGRVRVEFPDGQVCQYAKEHFANNNITLHVTGEDPVATILTANIAKLVQ